MGRSPCCAKEGLNRGAWTAIEDHILTEYITTHGEGNWRNLPKRAGLKRCGKSCRLRWLNYLRPDIKRGNITRDEEDLIVRLHKLLGNRWSLIAGRLPGRTDNEIKNYWNTSLSKKLHLHHHHHHHHPNNNSPAASAAAARRSRKTRKPQPLNTIENGNFPVLGPESKAVRTKAVRCNRPIFVHDHDPFAPHHQGPDHSDLTRRSSLSLSLPQVTIQGAAAAAANMVTGDCEIGVVDFGNMDELGYLQDLYGLQGSEFSDIDNVDFGYEDVDRNAGSMTTESSEQPLVFTDEMFEDWTKTNASAFHESSSVGYWIPSLLD